MRATVEEYARLLARAFDGAIEVDGERIVAHKSGMLLVRTPRVLPPPPRITTEDRETNWSDV